jgi:hypothetical protein
LESLDAPSLRLLYIGFKHENKALNDLVEKLKFSDNHRKDELTSLREEKNKLCNDLTTLEKELVHSKIQKDTLESDLFEVNNVTIPSLQSENTCWRRQAELRTLILNEERDQYRATVDDLWETVHKERILVNNALNELQKAGKLNIEESWNETKNQLMKLRAEYSALKEIVLTQNLQNARNFINLNKQN